MMRRGYAQRVIAVDYASHSGASWRRSALRWWRHCAGISPRVPQDAVSYSTVSGGGWMSRLDAGYWFRNRAAAGAVSPKATRGLIEAGHRVFVEITTRTRY
ncbi:hypothetical protein GCM10018952_19450 [Streptosporangium vulgare]